jgi:hypothetical protein
LKDTPRINGAPAMSLSSEDAMSTATRLMVGGPPADCL